MRWKGCRPWAANGLSLKANSGRKTVACKNETRLLRCGFVVRQPAAIRKVLKQAEGFSHKFNRSSCQPYPMEKHIQEKQTPSADRPALLVIDMVKDNFVAERNLPITPLARRIIAPINHLIGGFRTRRWPVVFSTDAFQEEDFIFTGRMSPHSLKGSQGAEIIEELDRTSEDFWLPKPRFSAFFDTGLEDWLRQRGVTLCAVAGIATNFCVLTTAMDALCHDFKAVILSDCTTAFTEEIHQQTLALYRKNPLYPLFRVLTAGAFLELLPDNEAS